MQAFVLGHYISGKDEAYVILKKISFIMSQSTVEPEIFRRHAAHRKSDFSRRQWKTERLGRCIM